MVITRCEEIDLLTLNKYRIIDQQGNSMWIGKEALFRAIASNQIYVVNMYISPDRRLIRTEETFEMGMFKLQVKDMLNRAQVMSCDIKEERRNGVVEYYRLTDANDNVILIIMPNLKSIPHQACKCTGRLSIVGGFSITQCYNTFADATASSIDLSGFCSRNVTTFESAFEDCLAKEIILGNLDTSKVISMESMFRSCSVMNLDLSHLDTSNVKNMSRMFEDFKGNVLDLSSFNTSKVTRMDSMFHNCNVPVIDISNFDTTLTASQTDMFNACKASYINIAGMSQQCLKYDERTKMMIKANKNLRGAFHNCNAQINMTDKNVVRIGRM